MTYVAVHVTCRIREVLGRRAIIDTEIIRYGTSPSIDLDDIDVLGDVIRIDDRPWPISQ